MMVLCFGRTLLPKWKLHFWLCPLLSLWWKAVHSVSGPSRSGLAGLGWSRAPVTAGGEGSRLLAEAGGVCAVLSACVRGWGPGSSRCSHL